jgi:hypothetical protein
MPVIGRSEVVAMSDQIEDALWSGGGFSDRTLPSIS